jgi:hypothetical protein
MATYSDAFVSIDADGSGENTTEIKRVVRVFVHVRKSVFSLCVYVYECACESQAQQHTKTNKIKTSTSLKCVNT